MSTESPQPPPGELDDGRPDRVPVRGATYSLFGPLDSTAPFHELLAQLVDDALREVPDGRALLARIDGASRRRWPLSPERRLPSALARLTEALRPFTPDARTYARRVRLKRFLDWRLGTTEAQLHLAMVEVELCNRLFRDDFARCDERIALLPHCLRDFSVECRARSDGFDLVCAGCSRACWLRRLSRALRQRGVTPYVWMRSDFVGRARELDRQGRRLGVLGVACYPELIEGMRQCRKAGIPALGLPLDANRCRRWVGEFLINSTDLEQLARILDG
jgi:hypothetical protein